MSVVKANLGANDASIYNAKFVHYFLGIFRITWMVPTIKVSNAIDGTPKKVSPKIN